MISPQINDTAADICERLIEINAQISGKNAENTDAANIEAQFETKITLIKFIQKMWSNNLILENGTNGTNTIEKEMITYIQQNYTREISLKEFGAQFHLSENTYHATLKSIFILLCRSISIISGWSMPDSYWRNQQHPLLRLQCAVDIRM